MSKQNSRTISPIRLLAALLPLIAVEAPAQSYSEAFGDEVVVENRSTMFNPGGPIGPNPNWGLFRIDGAAKALSYRFRSPVQFTVEKVSVHFRQIGIGLPLIISVRDDYAGVPLLGAVNESEVLSPTAVGWQTVQLAEPKHLAAGATYHVTVEPEDPMDPSTTNYAEFDATLSRFPISHVPNDPGVSGPMSYYDPDFALMYRENTTEGFLDRHDDTFSFEPMMLLSNTSGETLGQPWDLIDREQVNGDTVYGQLIQLDQGVGGTVNFVSVFTGKLSGNASANPLYVDVIDLGPPVVRRTGQVTGTMVQSPREHWFGVDLEELTLTPGGQCIVALRAPGSAKYAADALRSTLPGVPTLPTYGNDSSYMVVSTDGGSSFLPLGSAPPRVDMPFVLAHRAKPTRPVGIFDEGMLVKITGIPPVEEPAQTFHLSAGSVLEQRVVTRNIGGDGSLIWNVFDAATGTPIFASSFEVPNVLHNTEIAGNHSTLPTPTSTGLKVYEVRVGHKEGAQELWDDAVRFEVRVLP